jgi:hypothetical protein
MPYMMRGQGGAPDGPNSYTDELYCEIFEYDLDSNQITKIKDRFEFQQIFLEDEFYMEQLKA